MYQKYWVKCDNHYSILFFSVSANFFNHERKLLLQTEKRWTIFLNGSNEKPGNSCKKEKRKPTLIILLGLASILNIGSMNSHDSQSICEV